MIRAVIDPGVLIGAVITPGGIPHRVLEAWKGGVFELVVCPSLLDELTGTLLRPKFRTWASANECVAFIETIRITAVVVDDPDAIAPISRDPNDDYLLALASQAGAHVLVSSDKDLTSLVENGPPVVTPRRFLRSIEGEDA